MKIRSSKELKESIQNVDRVIENEISIEPVIEIDTVLASAVIDNKKAEEQVTEILSELDKLGENVVEENPEAPMPTENMYTQSLKLDESIENFTLVEDGRKNRVSARDENDTNLYLDYDMLEFVYELLSAGSKGITNIAPKTPLVKRHSKATDPNSPVIEKPMKKFSPNGSQIINKEYVYLLDLAPTQSREISRKMSKIPKDVQTQIKEASFGMKNAWDVQDAFESLCARISDTVDKVGRDAVGYSFLNNLKTLSTPQISEAGNKVVVYSDDLDDFSQAAEGLLTYGITCESPVPKRNKTSHWDYSMVVNVPSYSDGEPMSLEDWMDENGYQIEDVMEPAIAKRFRNQYAKADKAANELAQKIAFEKWVTYAFNHGDEDLDDIYQKMCDELTAKGIECDNKFYKQFMSEFEDDYSDEDEAEKNSNLSLDES